MKVISDFLQRNSEFKPTIHIIGDSMVDEFYHVKVTRISPESPSVCVMLSSTDEPHESLPGGAANICYQLKNFNIDCRLFSLYDESAGKVFEKAGLDYTRGRDFALQIPRKKRFFDGDIQVGDRWDVERPNCGMHDNDLSYYQNDLYEYWNKDLNEIAPQVIILSDYNKGLFNDSAAEITQKIINREFITIVDPKKGPISKWKGCTIFKPNSVEAQELSGLSNWRDQCDYFQNILDCKSVVITQQGLGVVGKDGINHFEYRPQSIVSANKRSGAGDCFIGILALAISHGMTTEEASIVAFEAGSLFVQQTQRSPITPWQLQKKSKYIQPENLRERDFKLVFTNGCFDAGLTVGHIQCLRYAKSQGDKLVVAINSDSSVKLLKGKDRPFLPLKERMEIVSALQDVDYVVSFDEETPMELIKEILPDIAVKGGDYKAEDVAGYGIVEIRIFPYVKWLSTTQKIELGIINENTRHLQD